MKQTAGNEARAPATIGRPARPAGSRGGGRGRAGGSTTEPRHEMRIHEVAFALYEARGCVDGHDLEDWLAAEAAVAREVQGTRTGDTAADH